MVAKRSISASPSETRATRTRRATSKPTAKRGSNQTDDRGQEGAPPGAVAATGSRAKNTDTGEIPGDAAGKGGRSVQAGQRTGRRSGTSTTRAAISTAARAVFAERGYGGASFRLIAERAGVDPALIAYFFGSKAELFRQVLELPFDPARVVPQVVEGPREEIGSRLASFVIQVLEDPDARNRVVALLRSASEDNLAAEVIRHRMSEEILEPIAAALDVPDAEFRAAMAMTQIAGLTVGRHVVGLTALREADLERIRRVIGGTLQRYLAEDL